MCLICKRNFLDIRKRLVYGEISAGGINHGYHEFGCWPCDGKGNVTGFPFQDNGAKTPCWNVYTISRYAYPGNAPKEALSIALLKAIQFSQTKEHDWKVTISAGNGNWSYSVPDVFHEFLEIELTPNCEKTQEQMKCTFLADDPMKNIREFRVFIRCK